MLILPIRTNIWPRRTPYVNYALIIINVIIFIASTTLAYNPYTSQMERVLRPWAIPFTFNAKNPVWYQYITYAFLHGGWMHLIGNMYFLYLFGNNVCDRLGTVRYIIFYISAGAASVLGHMAFSENPLVGASGAIAGVTGAYLALFPQTSITVLWWILYFIDTFEAPAMYFIAIKMILIDNIMVRYIPNVAYDAHLAGYAFGIAATIVLLATGFVKVSEFDLLSVLKHWNRRRKYRNLVSRGFDPFAGKITVKKEESAGTEISPIDRMTYERVQQMRREISSLISQHNLPQAAQVYQELINIDDRQILPQQQQLDIANQLASENKHKEAAEAYEKFITYYGSYEYIEQVKLMLGLLYSRYLNNPQSAVRYLREAEEKLSDANQLNLCRDELNKLQTEPH